MSAVNIEYLPNKIARILINCPEKRNALTLEIKHGIRAAYEQTLKSPEVRAIIITGTGGVFCAGGDVSDMAKQDDVRMLQHLRVAHDTVRLCHLAEKPIIAAIEGPAMGSGAGIALLADTIVAGESASMGFPFHRVGLIPDFGTLHTLPRKIGLNRAKQAFLYAQVIGSKEAQQISLFDHVVVDDQVQQKALELAEKLAAMPALTLGRTKRIISKMPTTSDMALELEAYAQTLCLQGEEHREGAAAFMEKRASDFTKFDLVPGVHLPL